MKKKRFNMIYDYFICSWRISMFIYEFDKQIKVNGNDTFFI